MNLWLILAIVTAGSLLYCERVKRRGTKVTTPLTADDYIRIAIFSGLFPLGMFMVWLTLREHKRDLARGLKREHKEDL